MLGKKKTREGEKGLKRVKDAYRIQAVVFLDRSRLPPGEKTPMLKNA